MTGPFARWRGRIDPDRGPNLLRHPHTRRQVGRPHIGRETIHGAVGDAGRFRFILERNNRKYGSENLFLCNLGCGRNPAEYRWLDEVSACLTQYSWPPMTSCAPSASAVSMYCITRAHCLPETSGPKVVLGSKASPMTICWHRAAFLCLQ